MVERPVVQRAPADDFEGYFRREHPRLVALAVALIGDRDAAVDVAQEALLRTYRSWAAVAAMERPGAWTRRVLVNLCTDVHRRRGRERIALSRATRDDTAPPPGEPSDACWHAVRALPRLQRAAVALHYVDDLPIAEVADVLGVATGTVKTSLSRARAALAPILEPERPTGGER